MSKTKPIFVATGRNGNTDEAVVIADDKDEAILLLGKSHAFWSLDAIGWADEIWRASDVISRVDASASRPIPHDAVCFFKDGDRWCCVNGDFVDLQQSFAGFGKTFEDAIADLQRSIQKAIFHAPLGSVPNA